MVSPEGQPIRHQENLNTYFREKPGKRREIIVPVKGGKVLFLREPVTEGQFPPVRMTYVTEDGKISELGTLSLRDDTERVDTYKLPPTNLVSDVGQWNVNLIRSGNDRTIPFDLTGGHIVPNEAPIFTDSEA